MHLVSECAARGRVRKFEVSTRGKDLVWIKTEQLNHQEDHHEYDLPACATGTCTDFWI